MGAFLLLLVFGCVAVMAIPPLCRYRVCYSGYGFLHLTHKGALKTVEWAKAQGYRNVRLERI
jgi:hypothetical protein